MENKIKLDVVDIYEINIDFDVVKNWDIKILKKEENVYFCETGVAKFRIKKSDYDKLFPKKQHYRPLPPEIGIRKSEYLSNITGREEVGLFANVIITKGARWMTHAKTNDQTFKGGLIRLPMGGFFNHNSKDPNCKTVHTERYIYLEVLRDINKDEELTAKYTLYDPEQA